MAFSADHRIFSDSDPTEFYYNLTPDSGSRQIDIVLGSDDSKLMQRLCSSVSQPTAPDIYDVSTASITFNDVDNIMRPKVTMRDHYMMMRLSSFSCAHSVMNISDLPYMRNNKFWVWSNWGGTTSQLTVAEVRSQTWTEHTIPNGSYIPQDLLLSAMSSLSPDVKFEYTPGLRLKYVGTKPLLLPITQTFSMSILQANSAFVFSETFQTVPPTVAGIVTPPTPSNFTCIQGVNGVDVALDYPTPYFNGYSLINKLGFNTALTPEQRTYFVYNMKNTGIPNVATNVSEYISGEGEAFVILYPGAIAACNGNMLGPQAQISITCDEVVQLGSWDAVLARLPIASVPANTFYDLRTFTNQPDTWHRLSTDRVRTLTIRLRDTYGNPYPLMIGPPVAQLQIAYRQSCGE